MSIIVKGIAGLGLVGILSTGSYFALRGLGYTPLTLSEDSKKTETYSSGNLGKDYEKFLVSPFNTNNERFWNERFQALKTATDLSTEFAHNTKVAKAFSQTHNSSQDSDDKALNRVCHDIYKKNKSDITPNDSDTNKKKLASDLFVYCSALGEYPQTIKEAGTGDGKTTYSDGNLGKTKEDKLLSVDTNPNTWKLKDHEFFGGSAPDASTAKFFRKLHEDEKNKSSRKTLKERCGEAYKQSAGTSSETAASEAEVLKYCTLLGS